MGDDLLKALAAESRRIEEDSLFSARSHFEAARGWALAHYWIGVPTAGLAAVAGASAIGSLPAVAGVLALLVAATSAVSTFLNPSKRSSQYHAAGTRFNALRKSARIYREIDLRGGDQRGDLSQKLKDLADRGDELNKVSPQIPRWAFKRARRGIQAGEASYEIDQAGTEAA